ncbi:MAG: glycosyltransferase [Desulfomonilaceae bacterium]|nr:glycosyltransferase [Desulfomonilaceae bacterium]
MKAVEENPERISQADVIVGIPSYNEAGSIAFPTTQVDKGLSKYFGDYSRVIINCDNNSPDGTKQAFMDTITDNPKIYLSTPDGVRGKGNNFRNLFAKALELKARAVVVVDADLKSITPEWIRNLGRPLFEEFSFVAPLYVRHKYDGTITNNIAYPLTRSLYGRRVRQPIGGDFGFSGELAKVYMESDAWTEQVAHFGIDIWMTSLAMLDRAQVIQSFMGRPKIHKPKDPAADLGPMFSNVVGTIFEVMGRHVEFWREVKWSRPTAVYGFGLGDVEVPPEVSVNVKALGEKFFRGIENGWDIYRECLSSVTYGKLEEVAGLPMGGFEFPAALWAQVLYDYAYAYHRETVPRTDLVNSLVPLYNGRTLSFVLETESMNTQQVEELIEDQCMQFEKTKRYLLDRWFGA